MKLLFLLPALVLLSAAALPPALPPAEADATAALTASPRHSEWVTVPGAGGFDAFVVYPERANKAPVVVLIHEIFGLTDWARSIADAYAAQGFLVIAPDFLSGHAPDGKGGSAVLGPSGSQAVIGKIPSTEIVARLDAAAAWATAQPSATRNYGVVGFCWGGGVSYSWATAQPGLKAVVGFYGTAPATAALSKITAPVLAFYGGNDARVTTTMAPFRDEMARLGKSFEPQVYEGAGHAFLRQQSGMSGANLKATQAAWPRSLAFLRQALEVAAVSSTTSLAVPASFADDCCEEEVDQS